MALIRLQVLNLFRKPFKGLSVFLELPGSPSLAYTAETTEQPIEVWYPVMSELQDPSPWKRSVEIKPGERWRVTVYMNPWDQSLWPSISFDIRGESRLITLCLGPNNYKVSIYNHKREPLPLSTMDYLAKTIAMLNRDEGLENSHLDSDFKAFESDITAENGDEAMTDLSD
ncbi:uncharacterized protein F4822DRAFT_434835 [Hypoxylon trugodes]|uniref:uncharacterized protein n=1 Tax=Hypoxylon trugodes TaxID=326681 RepID=UPI00219EDDA8|nr:uncharacterized protein F4822DRAFT_434835 [Hypoxylon trugodes]KAI1382905.1 hypothetical protein F4822DRAFT_434835 [Hypoxylon trugodes]